MPDITQRYIGKAYPSFMQPKPRAGRLPDLGYGDSYRTAAVPNYGVFAIHRTTVMGLPEPSLYQIGNAQFYLPPLPQRPYVCLRSL